MIKIRVEGIGAASNMLARANKKFLGAADKAIVDSSLFLMGEVKQSIAGHRPERKSVDTGRFLNSVSARRVKKLKSEVTSDVEYAKHLEHGTSRIRARRHFGNSATRNKPKIIAYVAKELRKVKV